MPRYTGQNYSLAYALANIGERFWKTYHADLYCYASDRKREDILDKIHQEWTEGNNLSRNGTKIRIEWALAIYDHGDWEKSLSMSVPDYRAGHSKEYVNDPRKNYPAEYRCDNGVYVRSLSELCIANWLYANKIPFEYERAIPFEYIGKSLLCDFYLPQENVYIEFWGKPEDDGYAQYMRRKESLYAQSGYRLVSLYLEDLKNLRDQFYMKLKKVQG